MRSAIRNGQKMGVPDGGLKIARPRRRASGSGPHEIALADNRQRRSTAPRSLEIAALTARKAVLTLPVRTPAYVSREVGAAELGISPET
jgi:hypothetical protein